MGNPLRACILVSAPALDDIRAEDLLGDQIHDRDQRDHDDRACRRQLVAVQTRVRIGQIGQGDVPFVHDQRNEVEFLRDADKRQYETGHKAVLCKREDDLRKSAPEARSVDGRRFLQLCADLQHGRGTALACVREVLDR